MTIYTSCDIIVTGYFYPAAAFCPADITKERAIYMDNNYNNRNYDPNSQRPRKRVSKKTLRRRQLTALCVIAFLVLLLVILMAKACTKDSTKKGGDTAPTETTTTTALTTTAQAATSATTTTTTTTRTEGANDSGFKLDKYSVYIDIGGTALPIVQAYPDGSSEPDEVWTSSDPKIATVDSYGHITGVSGGECYVTVGTRKDPSKEATVKVVVAGPANTANPDVPGENTPNTDNNKITNPEPQQLAEAPAPSKISGEGFHYEGDVLIVNKTYSIPSTYDPGALDPTCTEWFNKLAQGAAKEGLNIYISSGYRSYNDQNTIYNGYCQGYGQATADTFSARPGHSEHQTGLAIDVNIIDDSFAGTPEAIWIENHCWEYGFILRYPKGKQDITGYKYEPWHIRYVGSEISKKIHDAGGITLEEYYGLTSQYQS